MKRITSKLIPVTLFLILYVSYAMAQDTIPSLSSKPDRPDNFWHRVAIGGNIGFQFGSVTGINIAPEIRIRTVDQLYVGLRFIYQYYNYKNYFYNLDTKSYLSYQSNVLGGAVYLRYYLSSLFSSFLANVFAHVEYEYMTYSRPFVSSPRGNIVDPYGLTYIPGKQIIEINSIFVGGGYRQPITDHISFELLLLFNLNDTYNSPYSNPIFRLGVGVGL